MKKILTHTLASAFILGIFFLPTVSLLGCTGTECPPTESTPNNPTDSDYNSPGGSNVTVNTKIINPFRTGGSITDLFLAILNGIVLPIGGILVVLAFIYSGFKFVMAQGNETEIKDARRNLLYVAIGTVILLGASAIAGAINTTLKQFQ